MGGDGEGGGRAEDRQKAALPPPLSEGAQLSHPASIVAGRPRGRAGCCSTWPGQLLSQTAPGRPALIQTGNRQPSSRERLGCREWATAVGGGRTLRANSLGPRGGLGPALFSWRKPRWSPRKRTLPWCIWETEHLEFLANQFGLVVKVPG